jgi:hypothetical protein
VGLQNSELGRIQAAKPDGKSAFMPAEQLRLNGSGIRATLRERTDRSGLHRCGYHSGCKGCNAARKLHRGHLSCIATGGLG